MPVGRGRCIVWFLKNSKGVAGVLLVVGITIVTVGLAHSGGCRG